MTSTATSLNARQINSWKWKSPAEKTSARGCLSFRRATFKQKPLIYTLSFLYVTRFFNETVEMLEWDFFRCTMIFPLERGSPIVRSKHLCFCKAGFHESALEGRRGKKTRERGWMNKNRLSSLILEAPPVRDKLSETLWFNPVISMAFVSFVSFSLGKLNKICSPEKSMRNFYFLSTNTTITFRKMLKTWGMMN